MPGFGNLRIVAGPAEMALAFEQELSLAHHPGFISWTGVYIRLCRSIYLTLGKIFLTISPPEDALVPSALLSQKLGRAHRNTKTPVIHSVGGWYAYFPNHAARSPPTLSRNSAGFAHRHGGTEPVCPIDDLGICDRRGHRSQQRSGEGS